MDILTITMKKLRFVYGNSPSVTRKAVAMWLPLLMLASSGGFALNDTPLCPAGWVQAHDEGCFTFLDEETNLSWIDANLACEKVFIVCHTEDSNLPRLEVFWQNHSVKTR